MPWLIVILFLLCIIWMILNDGRNLYVYNAINHVCKRVTLWCLQRDFLCLKLINQMPYFLELYQTYFSFSFKFWSMYFVFSYLYGLIAFMVGKPCRSECVNYTKYYFLSIFTISKSFKQYFNMKDLFFIIFLLLLFKY